MLTQERLKELLHYDPQTGLFTWLVATNGRRYVGERAGSPKSDGYIQIKIDRVLRGAHRIAWFYMTGMWPKVIDHINGLPGDNRWSNLRNVDSYLNAQNRHRANGDNQSTGLLGVSRRCNGGGFQARIRYGGREKRLGTYPTAEEAHQAYLRAKRELHPGNTL